MHSFWVVFLKAIVECKNKFINLQKYIYIHIYIYIYIIHVYIIYILELGEYIYNVFIRQRVRIGERKDKKYKNLKEPLALFFKGHYYAN